MSAGMDGEGLAGRVELVRRPCRWSDQGSQSLTLSCPHHRYEEEINRRTAAENEFVVLKKVSLEALAGMGCGGTGGKDMGKTKLQDGHIPTRRANSYCAIRGSRGLVVGSFL